MKHIVFCCYFKHTPCTMGGDDDVREKTMKREPELPSAHTRTHQEGRVNGGVCS
jgi:hypothetical protein